MRSQLFKDLLKKYKEDNENFKLSVCGREYRITDVVNAIEIFRDVILGTKFDCNFSVSQDGSIIIAEISIFKNEDKEVI
ncbi:hypothetical protein PBI_PBS1_146 [Bacillus phage PBS1]|uniref:Uncharacterized protein n=1 Tax=Bacillus phage PBS1 TaxID=2884423 RepID=A0A223LD96_BPPB1|nr:hypothetical protein FK780_gp301 [Bacillus phage PBS1]AST99967.1 hypothetical protein PBI_PBS1_146 [Bacillus phage PBS1]BDE75517.1 hypothetical protein [Bacillus phage PBS1]